MLLEHRLRPVIPIVVCAVGIALPLFWDIPGHWRLLGAIQNAGHAVLFFAMALSLAWWGVRGVYVLAGLLGLGLAIEGVQYLIGKDCDSHDVYLDNLGSLGGYFAYLAYQRRAWLPAVAALGLMASAFYVPALIALCYSTQWSNYPQLVNFDELGRKYLIDHHEGSEFQLQKLPAEFVQPGPFEPVDGKTNKDKKPNEIKPVGTVLQVICPANNWPGVALVDLAPNWQGFTYLQLDVWLADTTGINLGLALRGQQNQSDHHDVSRRFPLQPGFNRVRWPLQELVAASENKDLLSKVGKLILFCMPELTRVGESRFFVDRIELVE